MLDNENFCCRFSAQILFETIGKNSSFMPNLGIWQHFSKTLSSKFNPNFNFKHPKIMENLGSKINYVMNNFPKEHLARNFLDNSQMHLDSN
jgi:hypothetical protein